MQDGMLKSFLEETKNWTPSERGERLMSAGDIADTHKEFEREGQSEVVWLYTIKLEIKNRKK